MVRYKIFRPANTSLHHVKWLNLTSESSILLKKKVARSQLEEKNTRNSNPASPEFTPHRMKLRLSFLNRKTKFSQCWITVRWVFFKKRKTRLQTRLKIVLSRQEPIKFDRLLVQADARRGGGTQQMFIRGGSAPRSKPLPFYIPFFTKRYLFRLSCTFY